MGKKSRRKTPAPPTVTIAPPSQADTAGSVADAPPGRVCHSCGKRTEKPKKCGACGTVSYCSRECQVSDWEYHKKTCEDKSKCASCENKPTEPKECAGCRSVVYCSTECQRADRKIHSKRCSFLAERRKVDKGYKKVEKRSRRDGLMVDFDENGLAPALGGGFVTREKSDFMKRSMGDALCAKIAFEKEKEKFSGWKHEDQAEKCVKLLAANSHLSAFRFEILGYMDDNTDVWHACFAQDKVQKRFFNALHAGMETEIAELEGLPPEATEDWISIASPSLFALQLIPFGPEVPNTRDPDGKAQFPLLEERVAYFNLKCWPDFLRLSLGLWNVVKQDKRDFMSERKKSPTMSQEDLDHFMKHSYRFEQLLRQHWKYSFILMHSTKTSRAIFTVEDGQKPFHDPESPRLGPLLALLSIEGRAIKKFKHYIYLSAGLLLLQARKIDDARLVSPKLLERTLIGSMTASGRAFFLQVAVLFAEKILLREADLTLFDNFLQENPKFLDLL